MDRLIRRRGLGQKVVPVADGLDEDEHQPQRQRGQRHEHQLRVGVGGAGRAGGQRRCHQHQARQCGQRRQAGAGALDAETLLPVPDAANEQAHTNDSVADDHHRGVDRVPRQGGTARPAGQHHRQHQGDLDHRDGQRQDQGAEGLTQALSDQFGVVHRADHRRHQRCGASRHQDPAQRGVLRQRHAQHPCGQGGQQDRPGHAVGPLSALPRGG